MMAYYQIRLDDDAIPKTTFKTMYESFEFIVLPFGLKNAPGFFMSTTNEISSEFIDKFVTVYLDDILIYSKTWSEHLSHIQKSPRTAARKGILWKDKEVHVWRRKS